MRKRINNYLNFIDRILSHDLPVNACYSQDGNHFGVAKKDVAPTRKDYELLLNRHLEQIAFFQHERLVHLLVTMLFALMTIGIFITCLFTLNTGLIILLLLLVVLLIPYIMHYYLLENGVQKMYSQYDKIVKMMQL